MTGRQRMLAVLIAVPGVVASLLALAGFLLKILHNELERPPGETMQAFYLAVGQAYSGGFVHGFSLCFFLTLLAVALGSWLEMRRLNGAGGERVTLAARERP